MQCLARSRSVLRRAPAIYSSTTRVFFAPFSTETAQQKRDEEIEFFLVDAKSKDAVPPSQKRAGSKKALLNEDFSEEADFRNFMHEPIKDAVNWKDAAKKNTKE
eukprot:TRINITY_DN408_c0_g2_i3.p1 TRINITY_DN408_c0_g2~~TRINITY_DN408_c0_g2_i3.p1  ORF type:complete len:104 (+),score=21.69 TRINITY_DN408_c0_g2_i3:218-529(+)